MGQFRAMIRHAVFSSVSRAENLAAVAAWKAHPTCQESIARVRPLRETRLSADYEVPG